MRDRSALQNRLERHMIKKALLPGRQSPGFWLGVHGSAVSFRLPSDTHAIVPLSKDGKLYVGYMKEFKPTTKAPNAQSDISSCYRRRNFPLRLKRSPGTKALDRNNGTVVI